MTKKKLIEIAYNSILLEASSWPSLGLVSKNNSGIHCDMDYKLFTLSAEIFKKYLKNIIDNYSKINNFSDLRKIGLKYEKEMYKVTNNINTHKGLIFALGIYFYFALKSEKELFSFKKWPHLIKKFVRPLKNDFQIKKNNYSKGEKLFILKKIKGARSTALQGYYVINQGLSFLIKVIKRQPELTKENLSFILLLFYFQKINDTNVISKIGEKKFYQWKKQLKKLLRKIKTKYNQNIYQILLINQKAIEDKVSPGGCADLIVLTWFIYYWKITPNTSIF